MQHVISVIERTRTHTHFSCKILCGLTL